MIVLLKSMPVYSGDNFWRGIIWFLFSIELLEQPVSRIKNITINILDHWNVYLSFLSIPTNGTNKIVAFNTIHEVSPWIGLNPISQMRLRNINAIKLEQDPKNKLFAVNFFSNFCKSYSLSNTYLFLITCYWIIIFFSSNMASSIRRPSRYWIW